MRFLFLFWVVACLSGLVSSTGYLAIFGPRTVQHREKFKVLLTAINYHEEGGTVEVTLKNEYLNETIERHNVALEDMNKYLEFDLAHSPKVQNYVLMAKTADGQFEQSVEIFTIPKRYSVLVQTDKPVYKPGDKVNFRVVIINSEMKLQELKHLSVHIVDKYENIFLPLNDLHEDDEKFKHGVFTDSFELVEEPVEGLWNIKVMTNDLEDDNDHVVTFHSFEVKEYTLPTIKVNVESKTDLTREAVTINLKVSANYTFEEFVVGTAEVSARVYDSAYPGVVQHVSPTKKVEVETTQMIRFNIKDDLKIINSTRPYFAHFMINFTESLTGQKASAEKVVRVHRNGAYTVNITRQEKRFKPGFYYNFSTMVTSFDGTPDTSINSIEVTIMFYYTPSKCTLKTKMQELDRTFSLTLIEQMETGSFDFSVMIPSNTSAINITAKYFDAVSSINVIRQESRSREYIKVHLLNKPQIGKDLKIRFEGNELHDDDPIKLYTIVTNRMGIVYFKTHEEFYEKPKKIKITSEMAPLSFLTIYYIQATGEIIYDQVRLDIEKPFPLKCSIKLSARKTTPGSKITMDLKAPTGSSISILGVDESVTLLGGGNDIDKKRLLDDLTAYDIFEKLKDLKITGNSERYLDFGESNSFILTNALQGSDTCVNKKFEESEVVEVTDEDITETIDTDNRQVPTRRIRTRFPETWFFSNFEIKSNGLLRTEVDAPDTITSFLVSGFAIHPETGFGVAVQQRVTVFQNFFLQLYLPYSIRLGETLKVVVSVFNYNDEEVTVNVNMFNERKQFKFVSASNVGAVCNIVESTAKQETRRLTLKPNFGVSTYFLIRPTVTGKIALKVRASDVGDSAFDEIQKEFKVEHEGIKVSNNFPKIFDLRNQSHDSFVFNLPIAKDHIPSSLKIEATSVGDLIGPALSNIHTLIRMPSGCTEQTFKSWIPNIAAVKYLKSINQLTKDYEKKSEVFLTKGYQEVLKRKQADGSFSMWSETGEASTWLTAYVVKVLGHVKYLIKINDQIIFNALKFIKSKQRPEGNFNDPVASYHYISKTKSQTGIGLTAFVVISVFESGYEEDYEEMVNKSLTYLNTHANKINDNFAIAISAYALALGNCEAAKDFVTELDSNAIKENDMMYWYREAKVLKTDDSPSINVEIAAYAIMAYIKVERGKEAFKIMNWLMTQRNAAGGFYSTTDTVIGIQALTMIAELYHANNINIDIKLSYENNRQVEFNVNPANARNLQVSPLEADARRINCNAKGSGFAYVQVSYSFNKKTLNPSKRFEVTANPQPNNNENLLHLKICTKFIPTDDQEKSNMALVEVKLPSGYVYDQSTAALVKKAGVRRIETLDQETLIVLYFDSISETEVCTEIKAIRRVVVAELKSSVVRVYDYNNKNFRGSAYYKPSKDQTCGF